jgi:hypothetical protein
MSDHELPDEEERVRALMRRSDGPVLIRPLGAPIVATRARYGAILAAAFVAVVVVVSAVAGLALNARRQEVAASPSPSPAAIQSSPPVANVALDARRMLLVNLGGHGIGIRTETDTAPFFTVLNRTLSSLAVGPNGTLAYWKTGEDDALPHELHVYDTTTRTDRTLLTLTDERGGSGGFMIWSSDGAGIAFGTADPGSAFEGRSAPAAPRVATWSLLDVASGARRKIATISGAWIKPVSWDRATDVATAVEFGRDARDSATRLFYVFDPARARGKATQLLLPAAIDPWTVYADGAAQSAVGLEPYGTATPTGRNIWTWPLGDPGAAAVRTISGHLVSQAAFRPGTNDVFVLTGSLGAVATPAPDPPVIQDLGPLARGGTRDVYRMPTPAGGYFFFRSDGSAIVVGSAAMNDRRGAVVDPGGGSSTLLALADDIHASIGPAALQASGALRIVVVAIERSPDLGYFPKSVGAQSCVIHGGGPPPGIAVPGVCRTDVAPSGTSYVVTFTVTWNARDFHLSGEPGTGDLQHSWSFTVSANGALTGPQESGSFPPQSVR